jgi:nucleoid-associated protein YgaU
MARETKVGLLAGLAFIICFAIILANRGPRSPRPEGQLPLVDQGGNVQRAVQTTASRPTSARPQGSSPADRANPRRADHGSVGGATETIAASGAEVVLPGGTPASGRPSSSPERDFIGAGKAASESSMRGDQRTAAARDEQRQNGSRSLTSPSQSLAEKKRLLEDALNRRSGGRPDAGQVSGQPSVAGPNVDPEEGGAAQQASGPARAGESARQQTTARPTRYRVLAGDSLYKIAAAHYGRPSASAVKAIFEANRSVLSSPDELKVGVELTLPVLDGRVGPSGTAPDGAPGNATRSQPSPRNTETIRRSFRWYQIQKSDTYVSIAREQLGDVRRWKDIHELNKDKFPDPQRIQWGVRIKLPADEVAAARGARP